MSVAVIEAHHLWKTFDSAPAVSDMSIRVGAGEVVALLGENGAGKSTVLKMLSGVYSPDRGTGEILVDGIQVHLESPLHAQRLGITMIHQELAYVPERSVAQNVFLGREPRSPGLAGRLGKINVAKLNRDTRDALARLGADIPTSARLSELTVADRQQVEIAKAISVNARVILMDEPTSALSDERSARLLQLIKELRLQGLSIVFTTHRVQEAFDVADRFVVMRDSRCVADVPAGQLTLDELIRHMVGRPLQAYYGAREATATSSKPVLEVQGLCGGPVKDVSFTLYGGEILGFGGLVGAGRSEMARLLFGRDRRKSGTVAIEGKPTNIVHPTDAIGAGIALVPEDRKLQGLVLSMSVRENMALASLRQFSKFGILNHGRIASTVSEYVERLRIRTRSQKQLARTLSGGNQQKLVLAKWLLVSPRVLILDEPTRGIDVGAKTEIYHLMFALAESGVGIIFISSELPELLTISDRIAVMYRGTIATILQKGDATPERFMRAAAGFTDDVT